MKMPAPTRDLIAELPKSDLHLHLDGSLRLGTLIELAKEKKVALPSRSPEGLLELVFKRAYKNLPEYLRGFEFTVACLQDAESLERLREFARPQFNLGKGRAAGRVAMEGDHLGVGVYGRAVAQDFGDRQRAILHCTQHHRRTLPKMATARKGRPRQPGQEPAIDLAGRILQIASTADVAPHHADSQQNTSPSDNLS